MHDRFTMSTLNEEVCYCMTKICSLTIRAHYGAFYGMVH